MWYMKDKKFNLEDAGDSIGFVYLITNTRTGRKYVGKKLLWSKRKLPPLKGKKRKRTVIKESDWQNYYGSNEILMSEVESNPEIFKREILHLANTKGELSYLELKEQIEREVLLRDDYYNGIINVRIHHTHLNRLKN